MPVRGQKGCFCFGWPHGRCPVEGSCRASMTIALPPTCHSNGLSRNSHSLGCTLDDAICTADFGLAATGQRCKGDCERP